MVKRHAIAVEVCSNEYNRPNLNSVSCPFLFSTVRDYRLTKRTTPHFNILVLSSIYTTQHINTQAVMSAHSSYTYNWAKGITALTFIRQTGCLCSVKCHSSWMKVKTLSCTGASMGIQNDNSSHQKIHRDLWAG